MLFQTESGELIHVELHGYGMTKFAARNLIYCGMVIRDYDRAPIQAVFWIGPGEVSIGDGLTYPNLTYRYLVIDVRQIDASC